MSTNDFPVLGSVILLVLLKRFRSWIFSDSGFAEGALFRHPLAVVPSLTPGRRIKKAPGKYVVLGGRRTTRLKSREPVDWSSI